MPTIACAPATCEALEGVVGSVLAAVLARSSGGGDGAPYPWIDTKLDLIDGTPLRQVVEGVDLYGRDTVYAWIQGRGLEALAGHARWCARRGDAAGAEACLALLGRVQVALEGARARGGGRLWFWLDRAGEPFALDAAGRRVRPVLDPAGANFSDLFHARGLCAAAGAPGGAALRALAEERYRHLIAALAGGRFVSDQQPFDPRNPVVPVPGRHAYGPRMIAVGLCALAVEGLGLACAVEDGLALIEGILAGHANRGGRWPQLPAHALVEFIDDAGAPALVAGEVVGDPGHACELVGLALWFERAVRAAGLADAAQLARCAALRAELAPLLVATVARSFQGVGMAKLWSFSAGRPANPDMPWWSLPETMRAAALLLAAEPAGAHAAAAADILQRCAAAFLHHYVNPRVHGWAYQTLDREGRPVRVVPATPDADPGYHTGLCLIQVLEAAGR